MKLVAILQNRLGHVEVEPTRVEEVDIDPTSRWHQACSEPIGGGFGVVSRQLPRDTIHQIGRQAIESRHQGDRILDVGVAAGVRFNF